VQPVSSVAAFVARYIEPPADDPTALEIIATLDGEARLALQARAVVPATRAAWLQQHSGSAWSAARLEHVDARASVALRRELQRRGLWRE
jgi:hypothetical protein